MSCQDQHPAGAMRSGTDSQPDPAKALRQQAEVAAWANGDLTLPAGETQSPEAIRQMLHELQVHQIELEMQNEELRRMHVELDAERARYFDLYDLAPVGYCTLSEQGLILEANFTAATMLGVARSELVGRPISRLIVPSNQDTYYLCRKHLVESGEPQSCELQMLKKDGTSFWAYLAASAAHDADGAPVHRFVLSDVSERKRMVAAMHESESRYRALIEWTPFAINVQRDGRFVYLNPAALKLLGASSAQELIGKHILDIVHPDFHQLVLDRAKQVADAGGSTTLGEMKYRKADGTYIDVEAQSTAIVYGGVRAIHVAWRDITERKRLDTALQEKNIELALARKVADKANRAKSDFLAGMSHELRSPLNSILGFAQLMEASNPPPTPADAVRIGHILQAGWFLLALINDVLDLAAVESGKLHVSLESVSLRDLLPDCQAMVEPQAQQKGISLHFTPCQTPCRVMADPTRLKQVIVNLLSNAIKYNRPGGSVEVSCREAPGQRVHFSVRDTGEGLSREKIAQLFQAFNRLGREGGTEQGAGIGLVISRRLIELMQGEVGVESTVGVGSDFWFELKQATALQPAPGTDQVPALTHVPVGRGAAPRTLLYIEENRGNLELVEQLMAQRPDLRLLSAGSGMAGIALARTRQPEVILMGISLPDIDGFEVLHSLLEDPATAHIPVLALSANAMPGDIEKGLAAGFLGYLTKPILLKELMKALDSALTFAQTSSARESTEGSGQ